MLLHQNSQARKSRSSLLASNTDYCVFIQIHSLTLKHSQNLLRWSLSINVIPLSPDADKRIDLAKEVDFLELL